MSAARLVFRWSIWIMALFGVAFVGMRFARSHENRLKRTEVEVGRAIGALRLLQTATHALQGTRLPLPDLHRNWADARTSFDTEIARLHPSAGEGSAALDRLSRAKSFALAMDRKHQRVEQLLAAIEQSPLHDRIGLAGLVVAYARCLEQPTTPAGELRQLATVLQLLEDFDFSVRAIDAELVAYATELSQRARRIGVLENVVACSMLAFALGGAAFFLRRIGNLHQALETDNAARTRAEEAATASSEDLRITLDSIGDAVIATDAAGRITRMNPVAVRLTGRADGAGLPLMEVFRIVEGSSRQPLPNPIERVLGEGVQVMLDNSAVLIAADGTERDVADSAAPIRDSAGTIRGAVLVFRDVSEQHQLEANLRQAQKLEAVGHLAGGVAHDFNNLLQVIRGNLSLATEESPLSGDAASCIKEADRAAARASELTQQLLAFGRRQALRRRACDASSLVEDVLKLVNRVIGETIKVSFSAAREPTVLNVDPVQIGQVIINLCVNARDAMPHGGRLEVSLETGDWKPPGAPSGGEPRLLRIAVRDTGVGMSRTVMERAFEPFFTTKELGKGTGLGLSVARGIVEQHDGFITVESTLGAGTAFFVHLPVSPEAPAPAEQGNAAPVPARPAPDSWVLVAEDEPAVRQFAQTILERAGYRVVVAADGEEACRLATEHGDHLVAAVLDVVMPRLNGPEAARRIQKSNPTLRIVLCTGYSSDLLTETADGNPAWSILSKPYLPATLLGELATALGSRPVGDRAA